MTEIEALLHTENGAAPPEVAEPEPEAVDIEVEVHIDRLTIGDLEVLENFSNGSTSATELIDFLQRLIDGDVRQMPMTALNDVMTAVNEAMVGARNPKD